MLKMTNLSRGEKSYNDEKIGMVSYRVPEEPTERIRVQLRNIYAG